jgi:hypothetical protein
MNARTKDIRKLLCFAPYQASYLAEVEGSFPCGLVF